MMLPLIHQFSIELFKVDNKDSYGPDKSHYYCTLPTSTEILQSNTKTSVHSIIFFL